MFVVHHGFGNELSIFSAYQPISIPNLIDLHYISGQKASIKFINSIQRIRHNVVQRLFILFQPV